MTTRRLQNGGKLEEARDELRRMLSRQKKRSTVERLELTINVVGQLVQGCQWIGSREWIFGEPKPALSILFQPAFEVFGHLANVPTPVQFRGLFLLASDLHPPPGRQLDLCAQPVTVEIGGNELAADRIANSG